MEEHKSRVYILTDEENRIIRLEGEYTLPDDLTDWILVEEGTPCDRLNLAQAKYLDDFIVDDRGIYRYKWSGTEIVKRTTEEMDYEYNGINTITNPSVEERLDALESAMLEMILGGAE